MAIRLNMQKTHAKSTRKGLHCRRLAASRRLGKIVTAVVVNRLIPKAGNPLRNKMRVELTQPEQPRRLVSLAWPSD
ncbi:MAG: hypothetical protein ABI479_00585 [Gallionella sp.]